MSDYQDGPNYAYQDDQTLLGQAMMKARMAEQAANQAKQEALAAEAIERAKQAEIDRAVELSVQNNQQLWAQRNGFSPNRMVSSKDVGIVAPREVIESTPVRFNGWEISGQQARDMVEFGQWSKADYDKALSEALAQRGYPGSFQKAR
ncbi:conserved hypothetical protein [Mesorhizobium prunaredense]|uniref:Uncharacterized protein n=1 Tax=Mesorhizobium prunaredense TaxID=1631249 RepID=A0A1R3V3W1_9HYPH|nr:hypothetical protein [Mesorhizobium prunaredense]SIT54519.1 conserved hypothetical protein [Mesorhizobium prunaredense]